MKRVLYVCASVLCLALAGGAWMVCTEVASTLRGFQRATDAITATANALPDKTLAEIQRQGDAIRKDARREIRHAADGALAEVRDLRLTTDARLASIESVADRRLNQLTTDVSQLRESSQKTLSSVQSLTDDARDSWDDLYWDVKASVASATVAAQGVARSSDAIGQAMPKLTEAAVANGQNMAGITEDVHTVTSKFVAPKTPAQRAWEVVKLAAVALSIWF